MLMNLSDNCLDNFTYHRGVTNLWRFVGSGLATDITELEMVLRRGPRKDLLDTDFDYATWGSQLAVALLRLRGKRR
jgi:hypothetical protein